MKQLPYDMYLKIADVEDTRTVHDLLVEAMENTAFPYEVSEFEITEGILEDFIKDTENKVVILLMHENGEALGLLAATKISYPLIKEEFATETIWYVRDRGRKGRNPFRMVEAYEHWAKLKNCSHAQLSIRAKLSRRDTKRLNRIYKKRGYDNVETMYIRKLK